MFFDLDSRGMTVSVYRNADPFYAKCTESGVYTGKHHTVFLLMDNGPQTVGESNMTDKLPLMKLVTNKDNGRVSAIPAFVEGDGTGRWCFSGNFIYCTDSRFTALNNGMPIHVHDAIV